MNAFEPKVPKKAMTQSKTAKETTLKAGDFKTALS